MHRVRQDITSMYWLVVGQQGKWNGSIGAGIRRNIAGNNDSGSDNNYHGDRIPLHFDVSYQAGKRE